jgi:hypothetical protein
MGVCGPEAEVGRDLFDDLGLLDEGNDPHGAATLGAQQRIGLIVVPYPPQAAIDG